MRECVFCSSMWVKSLEFFVLNFMEFASLRSKHLKVEVQTNLINYLQHERLFTFIKLKLGLFTLHISATVSDKIKDLIFATHTHTYTLFLAFSFAPGRCLHFHDFMPHFCFRPRCFPIFSLFRIKSFFFKEPNSIMGINEKALSFPLVEWHFFKWIFKWFASKSIAHFFNRECLCWFFQS